MARQVVSGRNARVMRGTNELREVMRNTVHNGVTGVKSCCSCNSHAYSQEYFEDLSMLRTGHLTPAVTESPFANNISPLFYER